jgi:hypothetical protein
METARPPALGAALLLVLPLDAPQLRFQQLRLTLRDRQLRPHVLVRLQARRSSGALLRIA